MADSYDSWNAYREHLADIAKNPRGEDRRCYIPSPDEIVERCRHLRWLQSLGFEPYVIESVMAFEHPTIKYIQLRIARGLSVDEITYRILPFLMNATKGHERTVARLLNRRWHVGRGWALDALPGSAKPVKRRRRRRHRTA